MSWIEIAATLFGLASVWLTVRQNVWCWPTGLVMVVLYIYVFGEAKLYSDTALQVIYVFLQIYGWYHWVRGDKSGELPVSQISLKAAVTWTTVAILGSGCLGSVMQKYTDAALPHWDAVATVLSLIAQWLMARKVLENWIVWVMVDVLSIGIYVAKQLNLTAGLYAVFLVMATMGYFQWKKTIKNLEPVTA